MVILEIIDCDTREQAKKLMLDFPSIRTAICHILNGAKKNEEQAKIVLEVMTHFIDEASNSGACESTFLRLGCIA